MNQNYTFFFFFLLLLLPFSLYFAEVSLHLLLLYWLEWISGFGTPGVSFFIQDKTLVIGPVDRAMKFKMVADMKAFLKDCADLPLKHSSGAGQGLVTILLNMNSLRSIISRELSCWFFKVIWHWCCLYGFENTKGALIKNWHHRNVVKEVNNACWLVCRLCWSHFATPGFCTLIRSQLNTTHHVVTELTDWSNEEGRMAILCLSHRMGGFTHNLCFSNAL